MWGSKKGVTNIEILIYLAVFTMVWLAIVVGVSIGRLVTEMSNYLPGG
jgi:hypothetical protein